MKFGSVVIVLTWLFLTSCQTTTPPKQEFATAKVAIEAAKKVEAYRHSPGLWHQAEELYRQGKALYQLGRYSEAKEKFDRSIEAAEKAENSARLIRMKTGEVM